MHGNLNPQVTGNCDLATSQARRQDLAAGEAKTRRGKKSEGGGKF